jgi:hypothetical protein
LKLLVLSQLGSSAKMTASAPSSTRY